MDLNGSPEFALIWKTQDMPAGPQICALRGRARRISGSGFSGCPTARANDAEKRGNIAADPRNGLVGAVLHGWPTPSASEFAAKDLDRLNARRAAAKQIGLAMEARLLGWATPRARDGKGNGVSIARAAQGVADSLDLQCKTVSRNGTAPQSPLSARTDGRALPLNPRFSLWLQGYPATWADCAEAVTRSSRKLPHSSSAQ